MTTTPSKHLVDPEIAPMLDMFPTLNLSAESLPQIRAMFKEMMAQTVATIPASPARAKHLEGLPPTLIGVGTLDLFLEEDLEYARRLMRAGVPTELHVYPGAFHGFPMAATSQIAQAFVRDYLSALKRAFTRQNA